VSTDSAEMVFASRAHGEVQTHNQQNKQIFTLLSQWERKCVLYAVTCGN
jgi:hypothetical protein